nr:scarecrow-like protein 9 [Quercus suber]
MFKFEFNAKAKKWDTIQIEDLKIDNNEGVVNATHGVPFFTSRFRQALFYFSTLFEMLEIDMSRELKRMHLENESYWPQATNVTTCEGMERIERPETYNLSLLVLFCH